MSISGVVNLLFQPYGNPGSSGEPLGLVLGSAALVGDASGGVVQLVWRVQNIQDSPTLPDFRRRYLFFIDAMRMTANGDPGNWSVQLATHVARPNGTITPSVDIFEGGSTITDGLTFVPSRPVLDQKISHFPIFWDSQEFVAAASLTVALMQFQTNTLNVTYNFRVYGRYYDQVVTGQRGFGRLIQPAAISQFEG